MDNMTVIEARGEMVALAHVMGEAYRHAVEFQRKAFGLSVEEADEKARVLSPAYKQQVLAGLPQNICWNDLGRLTEADLTQGFERWEAIKQAAREELDSGHRAAAAFEFDDSPWQRAQFLAVREDFIEEWQPRNGIERAMVETLAQLYHLQQIWIERLNILTTGEVQVTQEKLDRDGRWNPPRVSAAEAIEQAAAMLDRLNRLFMRTLRGLRDLRRYAQSVTIQNATQVNIGAQQVNAASGEAK